jgi:hypothetical protein
MEKNYRLDSFYKILEDENKELNNKIIDINSMNSKLKIKINNLEEENRKLNIMLLDIKSNAAITENNLDEQFIITQKLREENKDLKNKLQVINKS